MPKKKVITKKTKKKIIKKKAVREKKTKSPKITKETALTACEKYYYDSTKIKDELNWSTKYSLENALETAWKWELNLKTNEQRNQN